MSKSFTIFIFYLFFSRRDQYGRKMTIFNHTRYMPTYLIAFVIFDFNAIEYRTSNNILLRIFSNPIEIQNTAFGLETTEQALHMFENEFSFEIQYELYKLDQVVLPSFNQCSATSYGIVFYRENCLLYEASVSKLYLYLLVKFKTSMQEFKFYPNFIQYIKRYYCDFKGFYKYLKVTFIDVVRQKRELIEYRKD